ncbi:hypothetical protein ABZ250_09610 [Streptomyces afghaniensis]|uniref:hypothetical protein n=1 Tax=Streptomyces afghaniensis TaxID=66865 RepID=UPI0033AB1698
MISTAHVRRRAAVLALAALTAVGVSAAPATADDRLPARYTVDLHELPSHNSPVVGRIFAGHWYAVGENLVKGDRFPDGFCGTDPQNDEWRSVVLPDGKIGYTSLYCIA